MKATKIKMQNGCKHSSKTIEISEIYIEGCNNPGFFAKSNLHDYLKKNPNSIQVNIYPYPNLVPHLAQAMRNMFVQNLMILLMTIYWNYQDVKKNMQMKMPSACFSYSATIPSNSANFSPNIFFSSTITQSFLLPNALSQNLYPL